MSRFKICNKCKTIYNTNYFINDNISCPNVLCEDELGNKEELCDIDELMIPIVKELYKKKFVLTDSCSSHLYEDYIKISILNLKLFQKMKNLHSNLEIILKNMGKFRKVFLIHSG